MAASGFTPISLYYSTTASAVPTSGNLANGELGLNIADMKLYAKNSAGTVTLLASNAGASGSVTSVSGTGTVNGLTLTGTVTTSGSLTLGGTLSLVSPPPIGSTSPNTGAFTSLSATTTGTFGDYLVFNNPSSSSIGAAGQRWLGSNGSTTGVFLNALTGGNVQLGINNTGVVSVSSTGLAVTGAMSSTTATVDINSASQSSGITLQNSNTGGYGTQFNSALYGYAGSPAAMFNVLSMQTFYDGSTGYVTFYTKAQPQSTQAIALSLAGNGSVGIGTSSPANKLTVADNSASAMFYGTQSGAGDLFAVANSASEKFRITNAGNVGIGTSSPDDTSSFGRALDIQGTGGAAAYFRASGTSPTTQYFTVGYSPTAAYLYNRANSPIYFYTNGIEYFRLGSSGQIGLTGANYGSAGQVLTSSGSSTAPSWSSPAGGGTTFLYSPFSYPLL